MPKSQSPIKSDTTVSVKELLDLIPEELITSLAKEIAVDKWVKKLKAGYLFKLVMFSMLSSERLSLRIMEHNFEDPLFQALAPSLEANNIGWTGIRDRLMNVNSLFFQKLYETVYQRADKLYGKKRLAGYHIKRYDSTMIATFSHLLDGMKAGNSKKGKRQVKLTTEFSDDFLIQMTFYDDQAHLSEETALKEVIKNADSNNEDVHVFDNGLKSRKTFKEFTENEILFVTKLGRNPRFELQGPYYQDDGHQDTDELEFIQDAIVKLYGNGKQLCDTKFRLIQYRVKNKGITLNFLTNVWDISAFDIAYIYKTRWDIEVLFRFLKQEMNLTHFVCNDSNAIKVMLYCSLIVATLILIYKKQNNIKSYKKAKIKFFKELLYTILLEALEHPSEIERLKNTLIKFVKLE